MEQTTITLSKKEALAIIGSLAITAYMLKSGALKPTKTDAPQQADVDALLKRMVAESGLEEMFPTIATKGAAQC